MSTPGRTAPSPVARARNGTAIVFAANGFALASWMSRVPDVKTRLDLAPGKLSILLLVISAGSVLGLPLAGRIGNHLGASKAVRLGAAMAMPGVALAGLMVQVRAPFALVMPGLFLLGLGLGIWDVSQNLEGAVVERASGKPIMPWFHAALRRTRYDFLGWFKGTVVSGLEGTAKPDREIYELLLARFSLDPASTLFVDDSPVNVAGAARAGMDAVLYTVPGPVLSRLGLAAQ